MKTRSIMERSSYVSCCRDNCFSRLDLGLSIRLFICKKERDEPLSEFHLSHS